MLKPNAIRPGTQHEADTRALQRAALLRLSRLTVDTQAVLHAPSLDERFAALERTRDELVRLEEAEETYRELLGRDLLSDTRPLAAQLPAPQSWAESLVAQLALSLAAKLATGLGSERACDARLAEHNEHVCAAVSALGNLCDPSECTLPSELRAALGRWAELAQTLLESDLQREHYRLELSTLQQSLRVVRRAA